MPRGNAALRSLKSWRLMAHEEPVSARIPITRAVRRDVLATKNGDVLSVFRLTGIATDCLEDAEIEASRDLLARFLRTACDARTAAWVHTIKRRITSLEAEHAEQAPEGFAGYLHHMRSADIANGFFEITHYLTLVRRPLIKPVPLFGRASSDDTAKTERSAGIRELDEAARSVESLLGRFGPRRLSIEDGVRPDLLAFLSMLVNGCHAPVRSASTGLDRLIPSHRPVFRGETVHLRGAAPEDERVAAMMALKGYGEATWPGALDAMLAAPVEFIATHSFTPREVSETLGRMKWVRRQMDVADDEARSLAEGLSDAMDDVAASRDVFGDHHMSIAVLADDEMALSDATSSMASILTGAGLRPVREDVALEALWWAQIPGNASYRTRKAMISTTNLADLAPAHGSGSGGRDVPWGAPLAILETPCQTPFRFSFHEPGRNTNGSTLVFGPSGSGKTALIGYLLAASRALPRPPRIFCFDKDRGAEATIRAMGGTYTLIRPDGDAGLFNPFADAVDERGQAWLRRWIAERVGTVSPLQRDAVTGAVAMNAAAPPELRRFASFARLFDALDDDGMLAGALADWHGAGARSWLFDGAEDRLDLTPTLCGFDMTSVLRDPVGAEALIDYLFHRLSLALESGEPTIIVLDEAWRLIKSPAFASQIEDWLKTIRKMGGLVVFVSQEPEDAARSTIAPAMVGSTATKIFFPNETADERTYRGVFGLTPREFELIRSTPREARCFLVKQGARSHLVRLDLSAHPELLKVLSATAASVAELDRLRASHGEHWLRPFMGDIA